MRLRIGIQIIIGIFFVTSIPFVEAQAQSNNTKPARILFLLDGSSSMLNLWEDSTSRFHTAARIIDKIADSIYQVNPDVAFALRAYGTKFPAQEKNCYDTELEVPFRSRNAAQIQTRLKYLRAQGYSPIAWSLEQAALQDFENSDDYAYSIILITDGGESCGGHICETVEKLLQQKISFQPYILSLVYDAPLRAEYDCLGKFLTVTKEEDIAKAVQVIIDDNKVILKEGTKKKFVAPVKPKILTPKVVTKPNTEIVPKQTTPPEIPPAPKQNVLERPNVDVFPRLQVKTKPSKFNLLYAINEPATRKAPKPLSLKIPMDEIQPKQTASSEDVSKAPVTPTPTITTTPTPRVAGATTPIRKSVKQSTSEENLKFTQSSKQAKDTRLQVLFTDGKGKFYSSEPKMEFRDAVTKKVVKTAYRNMMGGSPDPILLQPGNYDIHIPGSKAVAKNVNILANQLNTVTMVVGGASIAFYYPSAPKRAVIEYTALVSKRFEGGGVVKQACDSELPYDPSNYHIEINTLPPLVYNVDVNFGEMKLIAIPEAGTVEIVNTELLGKVQFWFQMGDAFVPFYDMVLTGNPEAQSVEVRPGNYQVRYYRHGSAPSSQPAVISFSIKSKHTTKVRLIP